MTRRRIGTQPRRAAVFEPGRRDTQSGAVTAAPPPHAPLPGAKRLRSCPSTLLLCTQLRSRSAAPDLCEPRGRRTLSPAMRSCLLEAAACHVVNVKCCCPCSAAAAVPEPHWPNSNTTHTAWKCFAKRCLFPQKPHLPAGENNILCLFFFASQRKHV